MRAEVHYLKEFSPIILNGLKLEFSESTEPVGIVRATSGNLPNIANQISSHKKAVAAVLHAGAARHHRANPAASLRLEQVYGSPVLLSGLGSLVLDKTELSVVNQHQKETLQNLLRLLSNTPQPVLYFLAGSLPEEALVHLRQLSLLGMITRLQGSTLHKHALNSLDSKPSSASWFHRVRDLCLQYQLPHPVFLLSAATPLSKEAYKSQQGFWEQCQATQEN